MSRSDEVRQIARDLGADLVGIASTDRFAGAPEGFRPTDIDLKCRSVVVFARRVPSSAMFAEDLVPYSLVNAWFAGELDRLSILFTLAMEDLGIGAVPIPSDDPYEHWEADRSYGRAILSLRHAGHLAGLGTLGKNTLLVNERFGNMIQIGAVLVDAELEPDPIVTENACRPDCRSCLDGCPQKALDGITVNQELCRPLSNFKSEKGYILKKCNLCRRVCPNALGVKG